MKNYYPELPEIPYKKTQIGMPFVVAFAKTLVGKYPKEVIRMAYIIFRNESSNGKSGVNNNYIGCQADNARWEGLPMENVIGTCVKTDNAGDTRRFICFNENGYKDCFEFLCYKVQQREMFLKEETTTNLLFPMIEKIAEPLYHLYEQKWVSNPKEDTSEAKANFISLYNSALKAIAILILIVFSNFGFSQTITVKHKFYTLEFDTTLKSPLLSWYIQTTAHATSTTKIDRKSVASFHQDPLIDSKYQVANDQEYKNNGKFDKGHLSPYSAFYFDLDAAKESMYYTNTAPQYSFFNEHPWEKLEQYVLKTLAPKNDSIFVYTGCIYDDKKMNDVPIPDYYWKLIKYNGIEKAWLASNEETKNTDFTHYEIEPNKLREILKGYYPNLKF